jgi:hypothetical protein
VLCGVLRRRVESRSHMSVRSSGGQVHVDVRAALEARPVPKIGLGTAREARGVTWGRRD